MVKITDAHSGMKSSYREISFRLQRKGGENMTRKTALVLFGLLIVGMFIEIGYAFCPMSVTCPACGAIAFWESTDYSGLKPVCVYKCSMCGRYWIKRG
jgi:hypothetical protein